ncbi:putative tyrosine carboxypeptidase MATCAP2 isoform X4 [Lampetra fluviatilis]
MRAALPTDAIRVRGDEQVTAGSDSGYACGRVTCGRQKARCGRPACGGEKPGPFPEAGGQHAARPHGRRSPGRVPAPSTSPPALARTGFGALPWCVGTPALPSRRHQTTQCAARTWALRARRLRIQPAFRAVSILERTLSRYGSYEHFEQDMGGDVLSPRRIWAHVRTYMEKEGCLGEVVVSLHDDLLSRASMTVQNGRPTLCINTAAAREHWLEGMLQHEIGTHFLRGLNGARQPWGRPSGRRRFALRPANPTEEGLASVHSVLHRRDPLLWRAALLYYAVSRAAHLSFSALFAELGRFVRDPSTRWEYCLRAKRGQEDTSVPGCFNKDQVYLTGVLAILRHRRSIDFQMLYTLGKVSIEDVERLRPLATAEKTRLPHFLRNPESYQRELDRIISANGLSDSELLELMPD